MLWGQCVARGAGDSPGVNFDRTASRMFVANWKDWFPAEKTVNKSFLTLECERPTGPPNALWEKAGLLDSFALVFEPSDPEWALACLDNLSMVRSVPHWLRTGNPPQLWPLAIKALGFTGIPVPSAHPDDRERLPLGAGKGAAGRTRVPRRLLGMGGGA